MRRILLVIWAVLPLLLVANDALIPPTSPAWAMLDWQEPAPEQHSVAECANDGKTADTPTHKHRCACWNACVSEKERGIHGDQRCETYCRLKNCKCKPPCV